MLKFYGCPQLLPITITLFRCVPENYLSHDWAIGADLISLTDETIAQLDANALYTIVLLDNTDAEIGTMILTLPLPYSRSAAPLFAELTTPTIGQLASYAGGDQNVQATVPSGQLADTVMLSYLTDAVTPEFFFDLKVVNGDQSLFNETLNLPAIANANIAELAIELTSSDALGRMISVIYQAIP